MRILSVAFTTLLLGLAACKTFSSGSRTPDPYRSTVLQVDNRGVLDLNVYAMHTVDAIYAVDAVDATYSRDASQHVPQRVHLGRAPANKKTDFAIPPNFVYGVSPVRFIADEIGGKQVSLDQEFMVAPADTVVLTIPGLRPDARK
jgi:hypothetical protein